jgi:phosphotransferase system enzyme I (PtsP)
MLDVLRRIVQEVNAAPDLQHALQIIVSGVKRSIAVDVASVYLTDSARSQYVLMATDGFRQGAVGNVRFDFGEGLVGMVGAREEPVNVEDAPTHPRYRFVGATGEQSYHGFLGVPIIQHGRVLGVLVVRQRVIRKFAEEEVAFLVTLAAQLAGAITHAQASGEINRILTKLENVSFSLRGIPGSSGVAIGQALVVYPPANLGAIPDRKPDDIEGEIAVFRAAVSAVQEDLRAYSARMSTSLSAEDLALFDALILMLGSDSLHDKTIERIRAGSWAPAALRDTIAGHVQIFEGMEDPYLRERASDVRDLGRRILTHLQSDRPPIPKVHNRTILVGEEISVGQLAEIPAGRLAAVVSASGSSSSHVAILARGLGVPAVMGVEDLPVSRLEGQDLVVDGYRGDVFVNPTEGVLSEFRRLQQEERDLSSILRKLDSQPAKTPDGVLMPLYINTGLVSGIEPSLYCEGDGVGLYRTEIPFLVRENFPGEEEQFRIYRQILEAVSPRPVTLRTLDVGGDKMLSYFPVHEDNPFLGWRGIRITLDHPEIFLTQLRAMLRASVGLDNLHILLPMVTTVNELDEALYLIHRAKQELLEEGESVHTPPIGVMLEVPSSVYQVEAFARRVDFFSVGTNDLTQYLLAVDRNNPRVAELYDSLHPAVLRVLRQVVADAHRYSKPVCVCGEMAGDPASALILLGLGVDGLSMNAGSLPRVKWVIRSFTRQEACETLDEVWDMEDAASIRQHCNTVLERGGLGGLVRPGR